ncbi:hypothetical protein V1525DRAFT_119788 [Lipomyces kononenkoae]|uniref:Uncharacterized protein n=1 Tax=Lipomyces kononenkoae TaxID=34357 RepID=A0ACC3SQ79_LIPKO
MFNQSRVTNISRSSASSKFASLQASDNLAKTTGDSGASANHDAPPEYPWREISLMPIGDNDRTEYYVWGMDIDYSYPKHAKFKRFKRKLKDALAKGVPQPSLARSLFARDKYAKLLESDSSSEGIEKSDYGSEVIEKLTEWPDKTPVVPTTYAVQARMSVDEFLQLDDEEGNGTIVECIEEVEDEYVKHMQCTRKWHHKLLKRECEHEKRWKSKREHTQTIHNTEAETDEKSRVFVW